MRSAIFSGAILFRTNGSTSRPTKRPNNFSDTTGAGVSSLPMVVFADGSFLANPPIAEIARKLGLRTKAEFPFYDLVVVGAGPAGLAAAVYGAADGLHTLLIEREAPGGQAGTKFAHRKLSRFSRGAERLGSGPARGGAGAAFRRGDSCAAGGHQACAGRRAQPAC